jgi:hypothetical protein
MRALVCSCVVFVSACVGTGKFEDPPEASAGEPAPAEVAAVIVDAGGERPRVHLPADAKSHNFNTTLHAADPARALARARALLEDLGAEMVGVSTSPGYANLNARLPGERCAELPARIRTLGYDAVNENLSVGELRTSVQWIEERLDRLDRADRELGRILRAVADEHTADGLLILRELAGNERRNLESQLQSYADQARYCQVYVNFQAEPPAQVEG